MVREAAIILIGIMASTLAADWKPTTSTLMTTWAENVKPDKPWDVYPRPQFKRDKWKNLNGLWDIALNENALADSPAFDRQILVPFPVEAPLSGIGERATHVTYRREFSLPDDWNNHRILLHFDAVDWQTSVSLNGKTLKTLDGEEIHRGGYDRFSYDITDAVTTSTNELIVSVFDPTDKGDQPRGKQVTESHGIWYTPTTGIWQTVWLEPVSKRGSLRKVTFTPNAAAGTVNIKTQALTPADGSQVEIIIEGEDQPILTVAPNEEADVKLNNPQLWSPDNPHLYKVEARLRLGDQVLDSVHTYFGLRDIEVRKIGDFNRILLNGQEIFQLGFLDQGFWPDGIYTAPTPEALTWDIDFTLELGFNMIRKHIKIEPDLWYHYCDTKGVLVWQDAVNGTVSTEESRKYFESDLFRMVENHWNSPSIILWVLFNEGWGQYDTERLTDELKKKDPTRLVTNASGWVDKNVGDIIDMHNYPGPGAPDPDPKRASVLGEFGGLGYFVEGHSWTGGLWGYQGTESQDELWDRWHDVMAGLRYLRAAHGLCAAVYTQTTDVEIEANGLVTYDRKVKKLDSDKARELSQSIINPRGVTILAETALAPEAPRWQFTTQKPADDWATTLTESADWQTSAAGFGKLTNRLSGKVGTPWNTENIWIRREVSIPNGIDPAQVKLIANVADEAEFYINGVKAAERTHHSTGYVPIPISEEAQKALKPGQKNILAIHARKKNPSDKQIGQYADTGLLLVSRN